MAKAISWRSSAVAWLDARALNASVGVETPLLVGLVALGLVAHGLNMFQFPSFTGIDDEGIYASQAWAVLREGQLSPYTYVYDHVPGGWILVAAWMALTGGPHAIGGAIDSARVLMLLLHVASLVMLFRIARKLGCGLATAVVAGVLFTVSPLGISYERRLLLDNIMVFWCLLSLDLLLDGWGRLSRVTLSGVCFGVALLTKETAIFLLPPMLYIAWQQRWQHQARFAVFGWLVPLAVVVSWYPLYAALKGELLPAVGTAQFSTSGYGNTGVSLIDSLFWQVGRDGGGPFNLDNQFWSLVRSDWLPRDGLLLVGGALATLLNIVRGCRARSVGERRALASGLLGLLPLVYLARGGIVFDFYIVAALPFLCLNLAVLAAPLIDRLPRAVGAVAAIGACAGIAFGYLQGGALQPLYAQTPSTAGRDALGWIKANVPANAAILVGDDLWTDLREPGYVTDGAAPGFPQVQSFTKVATDPAIREGVFADDWRNVDYLVLSPGRAQTLRETGNTVAIAALQHAHEVKAWPTEGGEIGLWKVDKSGATEAALLHDSNTFMQQHFNQSGAFTAADGSVTSESEAYAMLRAVWSNDRDTFARTWDWSKNNLRNPNGLLAWKWRGAVLDEHSATDADTDAALALLMAGRRWNNGDWVLDGTHLANAIWQHDVVQVGDRSYVTAGDWVSGLDVLAINPSYFSPYAYHVFQEVDPGHDWLSVVDSGYRLLFESSAADLGGVARSSGLPPDWVGVERSSGQLQALPLESDQTTAYSYDAPRAYWRIALDLRWDADGRAAAYLSQAGFLRDEVNRSGAVRGVYTHDGAVAIGSPQTSVVGTAGALSALLTLDLDAANRLYAGQLLGGSLDDAGSTYWGDPHDLYAQEWGWFATALYANALPDLWHMER